MSIDRLWSLEGRVERLSDALARLRRQLDALQQQMYQVSSRTGTPGGGGGGAPVAFLLPTGIAAATSYSATASAANAVKLAPNTNPPGFTTTGGTTMQVYSAMTTAISGSNKFAWFTLQQDGLYYLSSADC